MSVYWANLRSAEQNLLFVKVAHTRLPCGFSAPLVNGWYWPSKNEPRLNSILPIQLCFHALPPVVVVPPNVLSILSLIWLIPIMVQLCLLHNISACLLKLVRAIAIPAYVLSSNFFSSACWDTMTPILSMTINPISFVSIARNRYSRHCSALWLVGLRIHISSTSTPNLVAHT